MPSQCECVCLYIYRYTYIVISNYKENPEKTLTLCSILWEDCLDENVNKIPVGRLYQELEKQGMTDEQGQELKTKVGDLEALDLLNFLKYIPRFIMLHNLGNTSFDRIGICGLYFLLGTCIYLLAVKNLFRNKLCSHLKASKIVLNTNTDILYLQNLFNTFHFTVIRNASALNPNCTHQCAFFCIQI